MTDKQIATILSDILFIVDTREQKNQHIIEYFESNDIPYIVEKVDSGDYSFKLPNHQELSLDYSILIERKNSWDEIAQNFTKGRHRFTREFERVPYDSDIHIIVENATWTKMLSENYRSRLPHKSFMASIFAWNARYNCPIWTCLRNQSGIIIHNIIYYGLREKLKNIQKPVDKE